MKFGKQIIPYLDMNLLDEKRNIDKKGILFQLNRKVTYIETK